MLYIAADENDLAPGVPELHLDTSDAITIILPNGDEIYVDGDGTVTNGSGIRLREADQ